MNKYMAVIEYDGTGFNGFQAQPEEARTVQQELTAVLSKILGHDVKLDYAGRTDAGVHARGQVIGFATEKELDLYRFRWSLNSLLPDDISVSRITRVSLDFDARRDARARLYTYFVVKNDYHSVFLKKYSILVTGDLDIREMRRAAEVFVGRHDFAPFASPSVKRDYTIRDLYEFSLDEAEDGLLVFSIRANAFLYNMVRIMVGVLLEIGRGERDIEEIRDVLETGRKNFSSSMAPARGLFLDKVEY